MSMWAQRIVVVLLFGLLSSGLFLSHNRALAVEPVTAKPESAPIKPESAPAKKTRPPTNGSVIPKVPTPPHPPVRAPGPPGPGRRQGWGGHGGGARGGVDDGERRRR